MKSFSLKFCVIKKGEYLMGISEKCSEPRAYEWDIAATKYLCLYLHLKKQSKEV